MWRVARGEADLPLASQFVTCHHLPFLLPSKINEFLRFTPTYHRLLRPLFASIKRQYQLLLLYLSIISSFCHSSSELFRRCLLYPPSPEFRSKTYCFHRPLSRRVLKTTSSSAVQVSLRRREMFLRFPYILIGFAYFDVNRSERFGDRRKFREVHGHRSVLGEQRRWDASR